ncbi:MAG: hypothetical protein KQH59_18320 [Desulfobulbaceae bacterium]|nr:hypothetical protein [Desulfobulbaceae bacterium]
MALKRNSTDGVYTATRKTLAKRLATQIAQSLPCPIAGCNGTMMTRIDRRSFVELCVRHQRRASVRNAFAGAVQEENLSCTVCIIGVKVKEGGQFKPPAGVCFVSREQMLLERGRGR